MSCAKSPPLSAYARPSTLHSGARETDMLQVGQAPRPTPPPHTTVLLAVSFVQTYVFFQGVKTCAELRITLSSEKFTCCVAFVVLAHVALACSSSACRRFLAFISAIFSLRRLFTHSFRRVLAASSMLAFVNVCLAAAPTTNCHGMCFVADCSGEDTRAFSRRRYRCTRATSLQRPATVVLENGKVLLLDASVDGAESHRIPHGMALETPCIRALLRGGDTHAQPECPAHIREVDALTCVGLRVARI